MKNLLRNLFYASGIVAALSFAAHNLRGEATAQSASQVIGFTVFDSRYAVMLSNGDVYTRFMCYDGTCSQTLYYAGNFFGGPAPTTVTPQTWSQIKGQFAPKPGN